MTFLASIFHHAHHSPNKTALIYENTSISYGELLTECEKVSQFLTLEKRIKTGSYVALFMEPSPKTIIGILGILKARCAYVPINPELSEDQIEYILEDSGADWIITDTKTQGNITQPNQNKNWIYIEDILEQSNQKSKSPINVESSDPAYIIYTSGSTGKPKGCLIFHHNISALFDATSSLFDFNSEDVWVLVHSYSFDFSVWEIFGALSNGATLLIPNRSDILNPHAFLALLIQHKVSILNQTPLAFHHLLLIETGQKKKHFHSVLRYVIFGGDKLILTQLLPWIKKYPLHEVKLINMYGMTEDTVHTTWHQLCLKDFENPHLSVIGKPLIGSDILLLNDRLQEVAPGEKGEIYVSGKGLCRGYLNKPGQTNTRFIYVPTLKKEKIYRTGDIGIRLPGGEIAYIGRNDDQVKIRGFRIELEEIRHTVQKLPLIKAAVVIPDLKMQQLLLFIQSDQIIDIQNFEIRLNALLPKHQLPSFIKQLDTIPLNKNRKVDKAKLIDIYQSSFAKKSGLNEEELIEILIDIWEEVLGMENITPESDFFELGGTSFKLFKIVSRLKAHQLQLDIKDILIHKTISKIVFHIQVDKAKEKKENILLIPTDEKFPVTYFQRKYLHKFKENKLSTFGNLVYPYLCKGNFEISRFVEAMKWVIQKHPLLRSVVFPEDDTLYLKIRDIKEPELKIKDIPTLNQFENQVNQTIKQAYETPMNLREESPFRVHIVSAPDKHTAIVFVFHHLIIDSRSLEIFHKDWLCFYQKNGDKIHEKVSHEFPKYAINEYNICQKTDRGDYQRMAELVSRATKLNVQHQLSWKPGKALQVKGKINPILYKEIRQFCIQNAYTFSTFFLAAFSFYIHKICQLKTFPLGMTLSTRQLTQIEDSLGPFINYGIFIPTISDKTSFAALCEYFKDTLFSQYSDALFPLEYFSYQTENKHIPLFGFMLNYYKKNQTSQLSLPDLKLKKIQTFKEKTHMTRAVSIAVFEQEDSFEYKIRYRENFLSQHGSNKLPEIFNQIIECSLSELQSPKIISVT